LSRAWPFGGVDDLQRPEQRHEAEAEQPASAQVDRRSVRCYRHLVNGSVGEVTTSPSGDQHPITHGHYRAVVTQSGATLRSLSYDGRDLVQGFPEDRMASGGRGQVLVPWPNRIRDGAYTFDSAPQQLPLSEPARRNASHGLVRWVSWRGESGGNAVTMRYRLMAQTGYPWTLDLACRYALDDDGLADDGDRDETCPPRPRRSPTARTRTSAPGRWPSTTTCSPCPVPPGC
jgi:hypothetical protein